MNNDYRKGFWTISILLLLSFVANIFIISKYSNIPKHDKRITSSLLDNLNLKQRYDIVYNSISFEWNSTIMDQDFNHQTLKSFINSGDVVFYYDSKSCYKCFLHGLTTIQEIQETGSLRNLVVISEQDNMRQFRKVMKDFRLNKIAVFWGKNILTTDKLPDKPFFCLYHDGQLTNHYFIDSSTPQELIKSYIETVLTHAKTTKRY